MEASVTWNLMIGTNPLWVAKQHGHSVQTMLEVYAAWLDGTTQADLLAIKRAMEAPSMSAPSKVARPLSLSLPLASPKAVMRLSPEATAKMEVPENWHQLLAEREGFEPESGAETDQQVTDSENNSVPDDSPKTP